MRFKDFQGRAYGSAECYYNEHENSYDNGHLEWLDEGNGQEQKAKAVLGPTGAGKGTFIKNIVGNETITIGDNLNLETVDIKAYNLKHNDISFVLTDTPGFGDSHRSNQEVVKQILQWLAEFYRNDKKLDRIIYVHSIMNPRMQGTAYQNLRMFKKMVGSSAMHNVILATSFWDQADQSASFQRELELTSSKQF